MLSKFRGAILGLSIGDALGMPSEGLTKEEIKLNYGKIEDYSSPKNHFEGILTAGDYTDDTQQTIAMIKSIKPEGFSMELFIKNLIDWYNNSPIGMGPTSEKAIKNLINGNYEGVNSKTCGAAMRVAPLGLYYYDNLLELKKHVIESSKITHNNKDAIAGALTIAFFVASCLGNQDCKNKEYLKKCSEFVSDVSEDFAEKILLIKSMDSVEKGYEEFGTGINADECVPSAVHTFFATGNFRDGMIFAVNAGGDTDSLGSMFGAIAGAHYGFHNIPKKWVEGIKNRDYLISLADYLYKIKFNHEYY
ncbi:MAG: hypothetical protein PWP15_1025 [Methanothermococcus sp.]|jgi:ADP-ribosylglycohydrolase|uniref:ADP-ribosylglycohydrolase family protein n=1 Tax=Methanothermococcus TaxID=155862 RepID=UPI000376D195|nr:MULTISPECIES: ADP-ribosylglycohydrolase family protein [Methanothermococcus]MDK2790518.1 hypothetical protein [Methanothermococcus sp.]MDK2987272.1 hypothetical protein [Methanothermococcus sp.]